MDKSFLYLTGREQEDPIIILKQPEEIEENIPIELHVISDGTMYTQSIIPSPSLARRINKIPSLKQSISEIKEEPTDYKFPIITASASAITFVGAYRIIKHVTNGNIELAKAITESIKMTCPVSVLSLFGDSIMSITSKSNKKDLEKQEQKIYGVYYELLHQYRMALIRGAIPKEHELPRNMKKPKEIIKYLETKELKMEQKITNEEKRISELNNQLNIETSKNKKYNKILFIVALIILLGEPILLSALSIELTQYLAILCLSGATLAATVKVVEKYRNEKTKEISGRITTSESLLNYYKDEQAKELSKNLEPTQINNLEPVSYTCESEDFTLTTSRRLAELREIRDNLVSETNPKVKHLPGKQKTKTSSGHRNTPYNGRRN